MRRGYSSSINNGTNRKSNKKSLKNTIFKIIGAVYAVLVVMFFVYISNLNMLPTKYLAILGVFIFVITTVTFLGIAIKNRKGMVRNILFTILAIINLTAYGFVYNYANMTTNLLDKIGNELEETEEYYVVTLKDSSFSKIEDIKGNDVYFFNITDEYIDVKNDILSKVNITFSELDSLNDLSTKLLKKTIDIMLVSSSQYSMIIDEEENFKDKTKIIYTASHKIDKVEVENIDKGIDTIENGSFNILISGVDTSGSISNVARSDSNIVMTVNTKTNEILLTLIPRDYYVKLHNKKAYDKLTHSGIYGINETITTIEDLLSIDINYYVRINFTTLIKLVDVLDGIEVNSDVKFTAGGYNFTVGNNHLDGNKALVFARERHAFLDGDNQRVKNQSKVIESIVKKVTNSKTILLKYDKLLNSLSTSIQTNITQNEISSLVKKQIDTMKGYSMTMFSLDGTDAMKTTYSGGNQLLYVMVPNQTTVNKAIQQINDLLNKK